MDISVSARSSCGPVEADADDLVVDRPAQHGAEPPLEGAPRQRQLATDLVDAQAVAGVLADEADGLGHLAVVQREGVARRPTDHAQRRDEDLLARPGLAGAESVEQRRGLVADPLVIRHHARERRVGDRTDRLVVVDADDRDLVGDANADAAAGLQDLLAPRVVAGHHGAGRGSDATQSASRSCSSSQATRTRNEKNEHVPPAPATAPTNASRRSSDQLTPSRPQ